MAEAALFDEWPERYDAWFTTPIGKLVRQVEGDLVQQLLTPQAGESVLDAGCGTGVFTADLLWRGARVVGLDISAPMLAMARRKISSEAFLPVEGDMRHLPFRDGVFDRSMSITALEFIADARSAVDELFRVTRAGGTVVIATLNSLSPWAARRQAKTRSGQRHILEAAHYRSPADLLGLCSFAGIAGTAVHFRSDEEPAAAAGVERRGRLETPDTGAFVAVKWEKPAGLG